MHAYTHTVMQKWQKPGDRRAVAWKGGLVIMNHYTYLATSYTAYMHVDVLGVIMCTLSKLVNTLKIVAKDLNL